VLRLESDAELVKVVTVHKSKGLEYPLVYLPFAVTARKTDTRNRSFFEFVDEEGERRIDLRHGRGSAAGGRPRAPRRRPAPAVRGADARAPLPVAGRGRQGRPRPTGCTIPRSAGCSAAAPVRPDAMRERWEPARRPRGIELLTLEEPEGVQRAARADVQPRLVEAARFEGRFERNWAVGSFTSLTRHTVAPPTRAQEENLLEEAEPGTVETVRAEDAPWHRFPRGSTPGNFLHEQLEWMAQEGFDQDDNEEFLERLAQRIRAPAGATAWTMHGLAATTMAVTRLPPIGARWPRSRSRCPRWNSGSPAAASTSARSTACAAATCSARWRVRPCRNASCTAC
jgi:exodeoxyribonuclease V beta subunit